jgi:sec-independent protein translocase protein TatA
MFGLHPIDLIVVLIVALLVFGPKKLPEMGSAIGKSIKEFRKGMNELSHPDNAPAKNSELSAPKEAYIETSTPISHNDMSKLASTAYTGEEVGAQHPND